MAPACAEITGSASRATYPTTLAPSLAVAANRGGFSGTSPLNVTVARPPFQPRRCSTNALHTPSGAMLSRQCGSIGRTCRVPGSAAKRAAIGASLLPLPSPAVTISAQLLRPPSRPAAEARGASDGCGRGGRFARGGRLCGGRGSGAVGAGAGCCGFMPSRSVVSRPLNPRVVRCAGTDGFNSSSNTSTSTSSSDSSSSSSSSSSNSSSSNSNSNSSNSNSSNTSSDNNTNSSSDNTSSSSSSSSGTNSQSSSSGSNSSSSSGSGSTGGGFSGFDGFKSFASSFQGFKGFSSKAQSGPGFNFRNFTAGKSANGAAAGGAGAGTGFGSSTGARSTSSSSSNPQKQLAEITADVRRLGLSGVVFGAICGMHGVVHGTLGGTVDRVLDGLSQIWFIFIVIDMVLTAATWIAGGAAQLLVLSFAMCPWCGHQFHYHRDFFQGVMACPRCFHPLRYENGTFLRDRPRFSRVDFSYDVFAESEEDEARRVKALPPVVDVDATVTDKHY